MIYRFKRKHPNPPYSKFKVGDAVPAYDAGTIDTLLRAGFIEGDVVEKQISEPPNDKSFKPEKLRRKAVTA